MGKTKQNGVLKRLRKNIMCGVLSCVLVLGTVLLMPRITARADNFYSNEGVTYSINVSNKTASVSSCDPYKIKSEVHIPAIIKYNENEIKVIGINDCVFMGRTKINKITLEEGIQCIGQYAFCSTSITEIEIPASINWMREKIFEGCNSLTRVRFKGTTPPSMFDSNWLGSAANNNITIELPDNADMTAWKNALGNNVTIKIYTPNSSSSSSITTSSPNQKKNNDGEFIEEEPVNRIPAHVCQYEWEVVREIGADQDGLEQYLCKLCGNVQSTLTIPASQYQVQELYTKVTGAGEGETVTYDTGMVHTVCDKLFTKLQQRKDITLVITYQYKGESYRTTFPAGADYTELLQDADQFYGMLGLNGRCGIETEKN